MADPLSSTARPDEVARFGAVADQWWDPAGPFRPLHQFNPIRLAWLHQVLTAHFARDPHALAPFTGLRLLDAGCGGGLVSEPMARLGFSVTGIDATEEAVQVARVHGAREGLAIHYDRTTPEALAATGGRYDAVLALEVIEHVAEADTWAESLRGLLAPGGVLVLSTVNRTLKSLALAKVAAEYVLRWVPAGTHDWRRFPRPAETLNLLQRHGFRVTEARGFSYHPVAGRWRLTDDLSVNYAVVAV